MARLTGGILGHAISGKSANVVFVQRDGGTHVRARVVPHDPKTSAQLLGRAAHGRASRAWSALTAEGRRAWEAWARAQGRRGQTAFVSLYGKALRVDGAAPAPASPPAQPFYGDAVVVTVVGQPSRVVFAASGPNRPGVVTELMVQPLLSEARRTYLDKYRHAAYVAFAAGALSAEVPVAPGLYACAARFVEAATGQVAGFVELGTVRSG